MKIVKVVNVYAQIHLNVPAPVADQMKPVSMNNVLRVQTYVDQVVVQMDSLVVQRATVVLVVEL